MEKGKLPVMIPLFAVGRRRAGFSERWMELNLQAFRRASRHQQELF